MNALDGVRIVLGIVALLVLLAFVHAGFQIRDELNRTLEQRALCHTDSECALLGMGDGGPAD